MNHLVITRFLIGVARPSSLMRHARVMIETLYASLAAQTTQDFQWIIVADEMIDPKTEARLRVAIDGHPNFHIEKVDPLAGGMDVPALCLKYCGTTRDVTTTRIDDDDALRIDFIEKAQAALMASGAELASYCHVDGLHLASDFGRYTIIKTDNPSCGMTLRSPDAAKFHVYGASHNKLHQKVEGRGGVAIRAQAHTPYFLSAFHLTSISRELRVKRVRRAVQTTWTQSDPEDASYMALLASFGLGPDFDSRIARIRKRIPDTKPALFDGLGLPGMRFSRLDAKRYYRDLAIEAKVALAGVAEPDRAALEMRYRMMRQAYYLL